MCKRCEANKNDPPWYVLVDGQWENEDGPKGLHALVHDKAGGIVAYLPDHEVANKLARHLNGMHKTRKWPIE